MHRTMSDNAWGEKLSDMVDSQKDSDNATDSEEEKSPSRMENARIPKFDIEPASPTLTIGTAQNH